jgi:hypothetical protein
MIHIFATSEIDLEWNKIETNYNCKLCWRNLKWQKIFQMIHFQITILFDNLIHFWVTDQLKIVLSNLKKIDSQSITDYLLYEISSEELNQFINDVNQLILLFEIYIEKKCIISIF